MLLVKLWLFEQIRPFFYAVSVAWINGKLFYPMYILCESIWYSDSRLIGVFLF